LTYNSSDRNKSSIWRQRLYFSTQISHVNVFFIQFQFKQSFASINNLHYLFSRRCQSIDILLLFLMVLYYSRQHKNTCEFSFKMLLVPKLYRQIHDCSLSWIGTGTSIKSGGQASFMGKNLPFSEMGPSWWSSYGSYVYLCNQFLSPLKLWVRISLMARCTRYNVMR
jgi:hypothetical protein